MAWVRASAKPLSYHLQKITNGYRAIEDERGKAASLSPGQRRLVGAVLRARHAPAYLRRVGLAAAIANDGSGDRARLDDGYRLTEAPGFEAMREICERQIAIYTAWLRSGAAALPKEIDAAVYAKEAEKTAGDPLKHAPLHYDPAVRYSLVRYFCRAFWVRPVARHLGVFPVLGSVRILYSPNEAASLRDAQMFHIDPESARQVKIFIAVRNVDQDTGPLTFVPETQTRAMLDSGEIVFQEKRVDDADIERFAPKTTWVSHTGGPGGAAMLDTSNCFHFGSRPAGKPRMLLYAQFMDPFGSILPAKNPMRNLRKYWDTVDRGGIPYADYLLGRKL